MDAVRSRLADLAEPILPTCLSRRYAHTQQASEASFTKPLSETMRDWPDGCDDKQGDNDDVQKDQERKRHGTSRAFSTFAVATT